MDEAAERRIERRLLATFGDALPVAAYDSRGLQTWGTFFKEPRTPPSPYTSLYVDGLEEGEGCGPVNGDTGERVGREKGGKEDKDEDEDEDRRVEGNGLTGKRKRGDAVQKGNGDEEGQNKGHDEVGDGDDDEDDDAEESGSSSEESSERSEEDDDDDGDDGDDGEARSFREQVELNLMYQRKRLRGLDDPPAT